MRQGLDFRILGPLEVWREGERVTLGGRKQRALLAILVLNANEVVSTDRLIDLLWGPSPPETAPTALHGHVSQLRKLLEPDREARAAPSVLVTVEPGYVLRLEPDQVDVERFTARLTAARTALAAGEPTAAERSLREALSLWRGAPLADLENEPFAQTELRGLADLRIAAIEERFEADLALGREGELIAHLERHIAGEPLRERPRAQLMLALYRAGRHAEALRAYQDARRTLVEHAGLEPSTELRTLERKILEQDPALDRPHRPATMPPVGRRGGWARRPRARLLLPAAVAVAAVALGIALLARPDAGADRIVKIPADSVVAIDLASNDVIAAVPIGGTPTRVSVGAGAVWVLDADRQAVSRIDSRTRDARTFGTGGIPTDLAAGDGALWVANGHQSRAQFVGPLATTVSNLDPSSSAIRRTVALPRIGGATSNANANHIALTDEAVWVVGPDFSVSAIDPANGEITDTIRSVSAVAIAAGDVGVWVLNDDGSLARIAGGRAGRRVRLATNGLSSVAVGAGAVWATAPYDGVVWRVDTRPRLVERTIPVGTGASAVAVGGGAVWVANALRGTVSRIDPSTNRVVRTIALGGTPRSLAVGDETVWVTVAGRSPAPAVRPSPGETGALSAASCGSVFYGGPGTPDRLIVSDMPLRGGPRLPTNQMVEAIAFVLRERGFRAGRYTVGYQSCDDSTAQSGIFDAEKCTANAKAFAAARTVIGVIGPYNSGCAVEELPIANRARRGPLAMLSPTNSDVNLTRQGVFAPRGSLRALYPTGVRNYARLHPTEADQGAADAVLARRLGARRAFVLSDGSYGEPTALYFRRAAGRIGVRILGVERWNAHAASYRRLAARVRLAHPDVIFLSGLLDDNGGALLRAVRRRVGGDVPIIANDGFLPIADLFRAAGTAARGVHVSLGGLPPQALGPEGRNFVRDFAAAQPALAIHEHSVYAAAAAATLLDAIAGSDGTRASVTRRLLASRSGSGIVGPFEFDARGDVLPAPITIVLAVRGGGDDTVESIAGGSVETVLRPPRRLVR